MTIGNKNLYLLLIYAVPGIPVSVSNLNIIGDFVLWIEKSRIHILFFRSKLNPKFPVLSRHHQMVTW